MGNNRKIYLEDRDYELLQVQTLCESVLVSGLSHLLRNGKAQEEFAKVHSPKSTLES